MMAGSDALFEPISIAGRRVRNRIVCAPHWTGYNDGAGFSDRYRAYLGARAAGGAGWIITEPMASHPTARTEFAPGSGAWESDQRPGWSQLVSEVHAHDARLSLTIGHAGRNTSWLETGLPAVAPSSSPSPTLQEDPALLSESILQELERNYLSIAVMAGDAGFDGVELQSTADYLFGSFLSPLDNVRTDEFGGTLEERLTPLRRVLQAIRAAAPRDLLVGIRLSADHGVSGGLAAKDAASAVRELADGGLLDYASVIVGSYHNLHLITPTMGSAPQPAVDAAAEIRSQADLPVVVAGRIPYPEGAAEVIATGRADLIAFARPFIADPAWPQRLLDGRQEEIRTCLYCNQQCVRRLSERRPISCVQNPGAGRERHLGAGTPHVKRRSVLVVGAGPAGLETATQLAAGGAAVLVREVAQEPGGRLRTAARIPGREEWLQAILPRVAELERRGVRMEFGSAVDATELGAQQPDAVVLATGGRPWRARRYRHAGAEEIGGIDPERLLSLDDVVVDPPRDERLLVVDESGSRSLVAMLGWLRERGCSYEIVTSSPQFAWPALVLTQEWHHAVPPVLTGVRCHGLSRLVSVQGDKAEIVSTATGERSTIVDVGRVLWSHGDQPDHDALARVGWPLDDSPATIACIGDARSARGAGGAISDGRRVARSLLADGTVASVYRA